MRSCRSSRRESVETHKIERNMIPYSRQAPMIVRSFRNLKGRYATVAKYFSQTANPARHRTPRTIIAIMYPVFQPSGALETRLKGKRRSDHPNIVSAMPTTGRCINISHRQMFQGGEGGIVCFSSKGRRGSQTIKLHKVVLAGLPRSSTTILHGVYAHLHSLALAEDEDGGHRSTEDNENDEEGSKRPSEVNVGVEKVGNPGSCESCRNRRGVVETKDNRTVLESRGIGQDDGDDVDQSEMTNPVDCVSRSVGLDVLTRRFHDHANNDEKEHGEEALASAPDVDDLGNCEVRHSAND